MIGLVKKGQLFLEQFIYLHIIYFMSNYKSRCISIKSTFLELWTAILYYVFEKMDSLYVNYREKLLKSPFEACFFLVNFFWELLPLVFASIVAILQ